MSWKGHCGCHGGHKSDWSYDRWDHRGYGRDYGYDRWDHKGYGWDHGYARQYHDHYPRYTRYQRDYHLSSHSKPGNPIYTWRNHAGFPNIPTRSDFFFIGGSDI